MRGDAGRLGGQVRIGKQTYPLRTAVLRGVGMVPYPWTPAHEAKFQRWWATEGRKRLGRHPSPDHDKNEIWDARAAYFFGFRNVTSQGVEYVPPLQPLPKREHAPESKIEVWNR